MAATCKRCNMKYTGYPALSRVDGKTQICSDCGLDEAMQSFMEGKISPKSEWPVSREWAH